MSRFRRNSRMNRAFTLMEVLLALAVSAIVLSVVSSVFFGALQLRNRTARAFDDLLPLQHAVTVIRRDLTALLPPGGTFAGELQSTPGTTDPTLNLFAGGQPVSPVLHTASGLVDAFTLFGDVQRVAYYLVDPTNGVTQGRDLVRVVARNLLPATVDQPASQWLMSGVETVRFQYLDGTVWTENWDSTTSSNLPLAVRVQIVPATEPDRENLYFQAPVELVVSLPQGRAQQTQNPGGGL